jgi:hypothetical protein
LIPEKESLDKWTIMGSMMSMKLTTNVPMDSAMQGMFKQAKQKATQPALTLIDKNESGKYHWIIFKIETPSFIDDSTPESQLFYIVQGESYLYINFVALKEKVLSKSFVDKWTAVFKSSKIVHQ